MARRIGGIMAGMAIAFFLIWAIEMVSHTLLPLPADLDIWNKEQVGAYIHAMPALAKLLVVAAWLLGPLAGGAFAIRIGERDWAAWPVAALVVVAGIFVNIMMYSHPLWTQLATIAAPLLGGFLATRLPVRSRAAPAETVEEPL